MNKSYLLDNEGMRTRTDIPNWVAKEFENFSNAVLEPTFPCYFGVTALKRMNFAIPFYLIMIGVICRIQCYLFRINERTASCKKRFFLLWNRNVRNNQSNIIVITFESTTIFT